MNIAITTALEYLRSRGAPGKAAKARYTAIKNKFISSRAFKGAGDYSSIRDSLWSAIYDSVVGYLSGSGHITGPKSQFTTAMAQAYVETADTGYMDGGGDLPLDEDTAAWARAELQAQFGFVDSLFENLKMLRKENDFDADSEAEARADGYCDSLDALYNGAKLAGAKNKMLTFGGSDGAESCKDCQKYKDQRHRASWWLSRNAVPPSRDFECKGYNCYHYLFDDEGNEFTI